MITKDSDEYAHSAGTSDSGTLAWQAGVAVFLVILGAKWALIELFGTDVPFCDQWNAEIVGLYLPAIGGDIDCAMLHAAWFGMVAMGLMSLLSRGWRIHRSV